MLNDDLKKVVSKELNIARCPICASTDICTTDVESSRFIYIVGFPPKLTQELSPRTFRY
ncbi:hypothetical protein JOE49_002408 [Paenibacillus sp. PvR133]|nr:hypothetical protein [Paenibacillus sp. PvR133]